jgi:tRNA pseudouridine55 synthase
VVMDGILLVDKPAGPTSHDVVDRIRRVLGQKKVGHTGTLDPQATGLLVLVLGEATRWAPFMSADKRYAATVKLGLKTDTQDIWGKVLEEKPAKDLDPQAIRKVLLSLTGERMQVPPSVSALKHLGRPLHEWARQGQAVVKLARPIVVHSLEVTRVEGDEADFTVLCSGGTYVRSLCAEAGDQLASGGCLKALRRLASGAFEVGRAQSLDALENGEAPRILGQKEALAHHPEVQVTAQETGLLVHGRDLNRPAGALANPGACRLTDAGGGLLAIGSAKLGSNGWTIHPGPVFAREPEKEGRR